MTPVVELYADINSDIPREVTSHDAKEHFADCSSLSYSRIYDEGTEQNLLYWKCTL